MPNEQGVKVSIATGVWGVAAEHVGNFMPDGGPIIPFPLPRPCKGSIKPVKGETVAAFSPFGHKEATVSARPGEVPHFSAVPGQALVVTTTDGDGFYQLAVPPGTYSILLARPGGWHLDWTANHGLVGAAVVKPGQVAELWFNDRYRRAD